MNNEDRERLDYVADEVARSMKPSFDRAIAIVCISAVFDCWDVVHPR